MGTLIFGIMESYYNKQSISIEQRPIYPLEMVGSLDHFILMLKQQLVLFIFYLYCHPKKTVNYFSSPVGHEVLPKPASPENFTHLRPENRLPKKKQKRKKKRLPKKKKDSRKRRVF